LFFCDMNRPFAL